MKIKITPEGNESIKEVEHCNVKEFLIFGNKKDHDGLLIDFHDWSGQYRYLIGSLYHFLNEVKIEKAKSTQTAIETPHVQPPLSVMPPSAQSIVPPPAMPFAPHLADSGIRKTVPTGDTELKVVSMDDIKKVEANVKGSKDNVETIIDPEIIVENN